MKRAKDDPSRVAELEAACCAAEEEYAGTGTFPLPKPISHFSIGAFLMPPIWGAAHGQWMTLLFYPLWIICDTLNRTAYFTRTPLSIVAAIVIMLFMAAITFWFAWTAPLPSYWRVHDRYTPAEYARREKFWAVGMAVIAIIFIIGATYYNLEIYDPASVSWG